MKNPVATRLLVTIAMVVSFTANAACARDCYVSPTGNDRNPGSLEQPVRTIFRGLSLATQPGDNVILRKGEYRPERTINLTRPGLPGRPITLKPYDDETAVVDGSITPADTNLIAVGTSHVRIEGLTVRNAKANGIAVWGPGERVHHVAVVDCVAHHCQKSGIYAGFNSLSDPVRDIEFIGNSVHHASLHNDGRTPRNSWAFSLGAGLSKNVTIRNNDVSFGYGEGIGLYLSEAGLIANNVVHDCYSVNLYLDNTTQTRVEANHVYSTGAEQFFRFNRPASGIQLANENYGGLSNRCSDNVIVNNVLVGNSTNFSVANYQAGCGFRNSVFLHNTCVDATSRPLHIGRAGTHTDSLIAHNIFVQSDERPLTDIPGPTDGVTFQQNLWHGGFRHPQTRHKDDLQIDPEFTRSNRREPHSFRLPQTSPATKAVTPLPQVSQDFTGRPRSSTTSPGAFD